MAGEPLAQRFVRFRPSRTTAVALLGLVAAEALLVATYAATRSVVITNPLVLVYPFVWIDASVLAVAATSPPLTADRRRVAAACLAVGYFLVLGYFGGLFGPGTGASSLRVDWLLPPGYSPALLYDGAALRLVLQPYKLVGYAALAYLVYVTVLDAVGAAVSGVVGLLSCVSCTWPILGTVATSLLGGSSAVAAFALGHAYGLGTLVFLSAVALLYYRPTVSAR